MRPESWSTPPCRAPIELAPDLRPHPTRFTIACILLGIVVGCLAIAEIFGGIS